MSPVVYEMKSLCGAESACAQGALSARTLLDKLAGQTRVTDICSALPLPLFSSWLPGAGVDVDITADSLETLPDVVGQPGLR